MKNLKSGFAGTAIILSSLVSAQAFAFVCGDYTGTWSGTCTRTGSTPATVARTVTLATASDCSTITATGTGIINPGLTNFRIGKDMGRYSTDTTNANGETHLQQVISVQWDAANGRLIIPQQAGSTAYVIPSQTAIRSMSTLNFRIKLRTNGNLRMDSTSNIQIWQNGIARPELNLTEACELTPVP
jgi:hypothetical protein